MTEKTGKKGGQGRTSALLKQGGWLRPGGPLPTSVSGLTPDQEVAYEDLRAKVGMVPYGGLVDVNDVVRTAKLQVLLDRLGKILDEMPEDELVEKNETGNTRPHGLIGDYLRVSNQLADALKGLCLSPKTRTMVKIPSSVGSTSATGTVENTAQNETAKSSLLRLVAGNGG